MNLFSEEEKDFLFFSDFSKRTNFEYLKGKTRKNLLNKFYLNNFFKNYHYKNINPII